MRTFKCRDAGYQCDYTISASSDDEILERANEHGRKAHGMKTMSEEIKNKLRSLIRDEKSRGEKVVA